MSTCYSGGPGAGGTPGSTNASADRSIERRWPTQDPETVETNWTGQLVYIIDGGGIPITTGTKHAIRITSTYRVVQWDLVANTTGSLTLDIWKDTYDNYPPTVADSMTGSDKPRITSSNKGTSTSLTGWTRTISAGDVLLFNVDAASVISRATLTLKLVRV